MTLYTYIPYTEAERLKKGGNDLFRSLTFSALANEVGFAPSLD